MYRHSPESQPERRTSPLALRASILGGIAIAIFSVLFLRLWYVQILEGDKYLTEANDNRVREIRVQAPRGDILDRNGKVLVANRTELAVQVLPEDLPPPGPVRREELNRLSTVTGMTRREINTELEEGNRAAPGGPVILKKGLGVDKVYFLRENQSSFPGVTVERVFTREYRQGTTAAHLFGNVGEVTAEQLKEPRYTGLRQGDSVGQSGIEYEYDRYLRGRAGTDRVQVDALGRPTGHLRSKPAEAGDNIRLTIDSDLQSYAEGALADVRAARGIRRDGRAGRRDPRDGIGSDLRSVDLHPPHHAAPVPRADLEGDRRAAREPGDPGALSHRIGLQDDHRDRGARAQPDQAGHDLQ